MIDPSASYQVAFLQKCFLRLSFFVFNKGPAFCVSILSLLLPRKCVYVNVCVFVSVGERKLRFELFVVYINAFL